MKLFSAALLLLSTHLMANQSMANEPTADQSMAAQQMALKEAVGKLIFNDQSLSEPAGQSCHSCHQPEAGFSDPNNIVSPGANPTLFGNRNAPSISYVKYNPVLYWDLTEKHWVGGFFYDGRATSLHSQADKPFTNPVEMGNASNAQWIGKVKKSAYADLLTQLYGKNLWDDEEEALYAITDALVSYENGPEFAPFSAKYDLYLQGAVKLTELEKQGLAIFEAEDKGNCAACHPSKPSERGIPPLFTDFTYDNIGLARNNKLPFLSMPLQYNPAGQQYIDLGLANNPNIDDPQQQLGKFKVPTLRNVSKTAPYMHNGIFTSLEEVVNFYNSRDKEARWGKPEVAQNVNHEELGDLKLTEQDVKALVAFLETLTDGYPTQDTAKLNTGNATKLK